MTAVQETLRPDGMSLESCRIKNYHSCRYHGPRGNDIVAALRIVLGDAKRQ